MLATVVALWFYFAIWIESSGVLTIVNNASGRYIKDSTMKVTRWYNLLALFWMSQFVIGCQHMIIAGAVATWFFTRFLLLINNIKKKLTDNILNRF